MSHGISAQVADPWAIASGGSKRSILKFEKKMEELQKKTPEELDTTQINVKTMKRFFFGKQLTNNIFTNQQD